MKEAITTIIVLTIIIVEGRTVIIEITILEASIIGQIPIEHRNLEVGTNIVIEETEIFVVVDTVIIIMVITETMRQ